MKRLDLDVASDFLVVAATLLELKAASLVEADADDLDEEYSGIEADDAREMLLSQLLCYKQYKNAAEAFSTLNKLDVITPMDAWKQPLEEAYARWKKEVEQSVNK